MTSDVDAVVVGAGIAGLAAAHAFEAAGRSAVVVDAADAPGGVMRTDAVDGYRIERGPSTVRMKPALWAFAERTGTTGVLEEAAPASRERFLMRDGQLVPVPLGPLDLVRTPLLRAGAKWRLLGEPFVRARDASGESVAEFVSRRLGGDLADALVGPFLTGVYAGDERRLGADGVFSQLVEYERSSGSIVRGAIAGAWANRGAPRGRPGTWSGRGGMGEFASAVASRLRQSPRLGTRVVAIEPGAAGRGYRLTLRGEEDREEELRCDSLVVATDASDASALLTAAAPAAAEPLAAIEYAPIATVALGVARAELANPPRGFGFLVPRSEDRALLGCLYMSQLFAGRAPEGQDLLHCMLGGTRRPEMVEALGDELLARSLDVLEPVLGLRDAPRVLRVQRWSRAVAQPLVGHPQLVRRIRAELPSGLALAGAYLDGVAVADALASGEAAAARLLAA